MIWTDKYRVYYIICVILHLILRTYWFSTLRELTVTSFYNVRSLFGDHYGSGVRVHRNDFGHYRTVDHPETAHPYHFQLGVDDGPTIAGRTHPARAHRMIERRGNVPDSAQPIVPGCPGVGRAVRIGDWFQFQSRVHHRFGFRQLHDEIDTAKQRPDLVVVRQVIGVDLRTIQRVGRPQGHAPGAPAVDVDRYREHRVAQHVQIVEQRRHPVRVPEHVRQPAPSVQRVPRAVVRIPQVHDLHVGASLVRRVDEAHEVRQAQRSHAFGRQVKSGPDQVGALAGHVRSGSVLPVAEHQSGERNVVLVVVADRQVADHPDSVLAQMSRRPYARHHQDLRAHDHARGHYHLAGHVHASRSPRRRDVLDAHRPAGAVSSVRRLH